MRRGLLSGLAMGAVVFIAGCGTKSPDSAETTVSAASTTAPNPVVFDPCTDLADDVVVVAGFDPATRLREEDEVLHAGAFCSFRSATRELLLVSTINSYEAYKQRNQDAVRSSDPINGRAAFVMYKPLDRFTCFATLETRAGFLSVSSTIIASHARDEDPCEGIVELATLIEPEIGEGN